MAKQERPLNSLSRFLPPGAYEGVAPYFEQYSIHLTLTRHRNTLYGDYRPPDRQHPFHRISVNATLNPYSFLVTLLHELAHLTTHVQFGHRVAPHGKEWKAEFRKALLPFLGKQFFPEKVEVAIAAYLRNPAASTCTDPALFKALVSFDANAAGLKHVDELPPGAIFEYEGRKFQKQQQLRTRSRCVDLASGRFYLIPGVARVKLLKE